LKKKIKKLQRDSISFFKDSKLFRITIAKKQKYEKQDIAKKQKYISPLEPALYGRITGNINDISIEFYDEKVINQKSGFSTLVIVEENNKKLINLPIINSILKARDFIAFREKSLYFIRESKNFENIYLTDNDIFFLFKKYPCLHNNKLNEFRTIITINPMSPSGFILKKSKSNLKLICIINKKESLEYISKYDITEIDALLYDSQLKIKFLNKIHRYEKYENQIFSKLNRLSWTETTMSQSLQDYQYQYNEFCKKSQFDNLIMMLKLILLDFSYKKDMNLLLPIIIKESNLDKIDYYNENKQIDGLIRFKKNNVEFNTFNEFIDDIEIEELFLRENIFNIYKDLILEYDMKSTTLKTLIKKTLKDGVYYEEI